MARLASRQLVHADKQVYVIYQVHAAPTQVHEHGYGRALPSEAHSIGLRCRVGRVTVAEQPRQQEAAVEQPGERQRQR